ncbi:MAG TPA: hypothetical protein VNQ52_05135 [Microbacteriaceae bacterium]|nr:hypothetical protein [Microbacteriaceae bacterium]
MSDSPSDSPDGVRVAGMHAARQNAMAPPAVTAATRRAAGRMAHEW